MPNDMTVGLSWIAMCRVKIRGKNKKKKKILRLTHIRDEHGMGGN